MSNRCRDSPVLAPPFLHPEQDPLSLETELPACWGLVAFGALGGEAQTVGAGEGPFVAE